mmetsp:Transcript_109032/g.319125  ORF Transcript_109032/g.319125 Transcript_109032/m.319125 type:complete len:172 (+) Transcript_109032:1161-1676(+)
MTQPRDVALLCPVGEAACRKLARLAGVSATRPGDVALLECPVGEAACGRLARLAGVGASKKRTGDAAPLKCPAGEASAARLAGVRTPKDWCPGTVTSLRWVAWLLRLTRLAGLQASLSWPLGCRMGSGTWSVLPPGVRAPSERLLGDASIRARIGMVGPKAWWTGTADSTA